MKNKTLIIDGIEYETKEHDFNKKLSDIKIPKAWVSLRRLYEQTRNRK
ncbi:MAG: hypothetical protein AABY22_04460 [Nanoarchaeota archaeon]